MILISHRGNISGPNPERENHPDYIDAALQMGYDVEVDIWSVYNKLWLGHDKPQYVLPTEYLINDRIWFHCKNADALYILTSSYPTTKYFWHQEDSYTLTSNKKIWVYPGKALPTGSIAVMPDLEQDISNCYAVCTDYITTYAREYHA